MQDCLQPWALESLGFSDAIILPGGARPCAAVECPARSLPHFAATRRGGSWRLESRNLHMPLDLVDTLSQLVAIPSVNPMGRPVSGPEYFEYRMTDWLQAFFDRLGLPWMRQTVEPKRDNIVARFDGSSARRRWQSRSVRGTSGHRTRRRHDDRTLDPDGARRRIYGRGSCDIKGGMAAMLGALARLVEEKPRRRPTVIMACTVNEEHGYSGAQALTRMWTTAGNDSIVPRTPDMAVIAEPTNLDVVVAHKGAVRWRCHTHGRAAHSSQPQLGDNAIYKMARVLSVLESYARDVPASLSAHPLCGRPSLSVGVISGGLSVKPCRLGRRSKSIVASSLARMARPRTGRSWNTSTTARNWALR